LPSNIEGGGGLAAKVGVAKSNVIIIRKHLMSSPVKDCQSQYIYVNLNTQSGRRYSVFILGLI